MPYKIDEIMLAPCGMNCAVCYKHVGIKKNAKPCAGCLADQSEKPAHCRKCKIRECAQVKGLIHCYSCLDFPCKLIKNLEKSYGKRYKVSLVDNSRRAKEIGISKFLEEDRLKWMCKKCLGAISLHDGECSECGHQP